MNKIMIANPTDADGIEYGFQYYDTSTWYSVSTDAEEYIDFIDAVNSSPATYKISIDVFSEEFVFIYSKTSSVTAIRFNSTIPSNVRLAELLGFELDTSYSVSTTTKRYSVDWGMRYPLEIENVGTEAEFEPLYSLDGGATLDGRTFKQKSQKLSVKWKCETLYFTAVQSKRAFKFFENLGSKMPLIFSDDAFADYGDVFLTNNSFQAYAEKDYIKKGDQHNTYKVTFYIVEVL